MRVSESTTNEGMARSATSRQGDGRDFVTFGIAAAAIILFVGTAGQVLAQTTRNILYGEAAPDQLLLNAVLLNIALIIMSWRRYRELKAEIEQRREAEAYAQSLAETDPLTGCLNRRSLSAAGSALLETAEAERRAVAALMLDLDHFKSINDMNGHTVGDQVLIELARRIRAVMPADALVARLGGDEFAVFATYDVRNRGSIDQHAAALLRSISEPMNVAGLEVDLTTSIGLSSSVGHASADLSESLAETLVHQADIAMYHAKKSGRAQFAWFEPEMESDLRLRNALETSIRHGVRGGLFKPFYERQIDLATGRLIGFEMLARWQTPHGDEICPDIFIPIAEDMGIICQLSDQLVDQALTDASRWDADLTLSVNISPVQLRDPWFAQKLLRRLHTANFPPQRLEVEITESCLHQDMEIVRSVVTSLKNQGVRITLDDFGTGYSSLSQLRSLPFDCIKIDRSFVRELNDDKGAAKIVASIIQLGRELDLPVTAEGIETPEILVQLRKMGDMRGQGYHYGLPADGEATLAWLASQGLAATGHAGHDRGSDGAIDLTARQQTALKAG